MGRAPNVSARCSRIETAGQQLEALMRWMELEERA